MKRYLSLLAVLLCVLPALGDETENAEATAAERLSFPAAGFSIESLDSAPGDAPQTMLQMYLPPADGFAPNINVQIQPFPGTIAEYVATSKAQFESLGWTIVSEKTDDEGVSRFEFTGMVGQKLLHFYARSEKSGEHVYLVTAGSLDSQWAEFKDRLMDCANSMQLESEK